ncbi:MAG: SH3 domain-containing protein [Sideroxydans sp.]|nr:SH3 domain-containing protein [Sideroxydans sp.]
MPRLLTALCLLAASPMLAAFEFASVAEPAIMYDANSLQANKLFVATRYLPLEQIVVLENWVKVRDASGTMLWIEKRNLSSKRYVVVTADKTVIRTTWDDSAPIAFTAPRQLGLEWLGNNGAWVKVRHRDSTMGYVKAVDVWGD